MADLTGDSMAGSTGELMGDLVVELGGGEAGRLTGGVEAAAVRVGEKAEEGLWTGTGDRHSGLLAAGEGKGVALSGFVSSGMNGSEKKRVPGVFTTFIWKGNREDQDLVTLTSHCFNLRSVALSHLCFRLWRWFEWGKNNICFLHGADAGCF